MSGAAELKPCPFCGGNAKREDIGAAKEIENGGASYIHCSRCEASTALHFNRKENLVSSWNDRTSSSFSDWIDDEMAVAAMEKIPGCDHDAMVDALEAAFNVWRLRS